MTYFACEDFSPTERTHSSRCRACNRLRRNKFQADVLPESQPVFAPDLPTPGDSRGREVANSCEGGGNMDSLERVHPGHPWNLLERKLLANTKKSGTWTRRSCGRSWLEADGHSSFSFSISTSPSSLSISILVVVLPSFFSMWTSSPSSVYLMVGIWTESTTL